MIQDMKTGGSILLNGDDDLLRDMGPVKGVDPEFFGLGKNCQFYATDVEPLGLRGSSCTIHLPSGESLTASFHFLVLTWYKTLLPELLSAINLDLHQQKSKPELKDCLQSPEEIISFRQIKSSS